MYMYFLCTYLLIQYITKILNDNYKVVCLQLQRRFCLLISYYLITMKVWMREKTSQDGALRTKAVLIKPNLRSKILPGSDLSRPLSLTKYTNKFDENSGNFCDATSTYWNAN